MVLPTILKKRHSLKDRNILPLIKKVKGEASSPTEYARVQTSKRTEEMPLEELKGLFDGITGEDAREILKMCEKDFTPESMRLLLHHTIIFANEFGQPKGQELREDTVEEATGSQSLAKKPKLDQQTDDALEQRVSSLEKRNDDTVTQLREQVRSLCLQTSPSEPLILLTLEELARKSRRQGHAEVEIFEELARQAKVNQGKIDLATLCLTALSGKAGDVITKALTKCIKKQKRSEEKANPVTETDTRPMLSPLANVYPPMPSSYHCPTPVTPGPYGLQYPGQYAGMPAYHMPYMARTYGMGRGTGGRQWRARGACLFCESTDHQVKDCQKMKLAKSK